MTKKAHLSTFKARKRSVIRFAKSSKEERIALLRRAGIIDSNGQLRKSYTSKKANTR